jgi:hypothetical protein
VAGANLTALYATSRAFHGRSTAVLCAALFPILFEIYGDAARAALCALTALAFLAPLSCRRCRLTVSVGGQDRGKAVGLAQCRSDDVKRLPRLRE